MSDFRIRRLDQDYPWDLFLLADESKKAISKYIHRCEIFGVDEGIQIIGVIAIEKLDEKRIEIKNIAVCNSHQKSGVGRKLVEWVASKYTIEGFTEMFVGTGDASFDALKFYHKCGFEMDSIRRHFFKENYDREIVENGIVLKHMIILKKEI